MESHERRIEAAYLARCSPNDAYRWMERHAARSEEEVRESKWFKDAYLEYVLWSRREPLIDLALARFGRSTKIIRKVWRRGNSGVRCAAWRNPSPGRIGSPAGIWCGREEMRSLLKNAHLRELEAFCSNPGLSDKAIISLVRKEDEFVGVPEDRYACFLTFLASNSRLKTPYGENRPMDGWAEHMHKKVFDEIWNLSLTLPATQEWAEILYLLFRNCLPPRGFLAGEAIDRWQIDSIEKKGDKFYWPGYSFFLRSKIADCLQPDNTLKDHDDLALRLSFYRRFDPVNYSEWPDIVSRDFGGSYRDDAAYATLENLNLWRTNELRYRLRKLCWSFPDPHHDMQLPNAYNEAQRRIEKQFPAWFAESTDETAPIAGMDDSDKEILTEILNKLNVLQELVTSQSKGRRFLLG